LVAAAARTAAEFPTLDVIVANAGIGAYAGLLDADPGAWRAVIDVNLTGVFNTAHVFVPRMIAGARGGSIVLIGSTADVKGLPFCSAYAASKHGLHGLRKVWAQELAGHDIRVNSVDPGAIDTKLAHNRRVRWRARPRTARGTALPRPVQPTLEAPGGLIPPTAISDAVAWLASEEACYVTGVSLPVDAGTTVR
jgi:(+)-trans-carveol dehydrogenase